MIGLWTGVPRSGKTYSLVYRIANEYCDEIGDTYYLKENVILISDIEGLLVEHYPLEDFLKVDAEPVKPSSSSNPSCPQCGRELVLKTGQYGQFYSCPGFPSCKYSINPSKIKESSLVVSKPNSNIKNLISVAGFKRLREKFPDPDQKIVIIIDECQRYFRSRFYDEEVFLGFEKHGHYGVDIYLITHHIGKLSRDVATCLEFETRLVPRRLAVPGFFTYLEKQGRTVISRGRIPVKQKYFSLYKSQHFEQGDKVKKPFLKYFVFLIVLLISGPTLFYFRVYLPRVSASQQVEKVSPVSSSVPQQVEKVAPVSSSVPEQVKSSAPVSEFKLNSYLSAPAGFVYSPVDTLVFFSGGKQQILVPYQGRLIPLALYPRKTIVHYSGGRPFVYEMRSEHFQPEKRKKKDAKAYKSLSFIGAAEERGEENGTDI